MGKNSTKAKFHRNAENPSVKIKAGEIADQQVAAAVERNICVMAQH